MIYSTYLGGGVAKAIAVDAAGNAYVTGAATDVSSGGTFPVTSELPNGGHSGAFVAKLNAQGSALVYSAILGDPTSGAGSQLAGGNGIAVDAEGNAYVAGATGDGSFPTTPGAFQTAFQTTPGGFIFKMNSTGTALVYSTLLGGAGAGADLIDALTVDAAGEAFVTGAAGSADFPVTPGAFQTVAKGRNAFVVKLSADGSSLRYSTFLGGSGTDAGTGIALDSQGEAYVTGTTQSADFPATAAFGPAPPAGFIAKFSAAGDALLFSDALAATLGAVAVDNQGGAYVIGSGNGQGIPVTSNAKQRCGGAMLVMKFSADGNALLYSSFFGDVGETPLTTSLGLALDSEMNVYAADSLGVTKLSPETGEPITPPCFDPAFYDITEVTPRAGIAPGAPAVIHGYNLGPQAGITAGLDSSGGFGTTLDGTQVMVGGYSAPLLYAQDGKIRFLAPFEVAGQQQVQVEVVRAGENSDPHTASVDAVLPAIIEQPTGCLSAVLNQDMSVNTPTNPAAVGSIIAIYAEGGGQLSLPMTDGSIITSPLPALQLPVDVWFQNVSNYGTIFYAGSAPGLVAGTLQVNVQIPANVTPGQIMFGIDIGGVGDLSLACLNVK